MPISSRMPCVWNTDPGGSSTIWATAISLPARSAPKIEAIKSLLLMFFSLFDALCFERFVARHFIYGAPHKMLHCKILMFYLFITLENRGGALASLAAQVSQWRKRLE
jgi:hypothetical protein